jgi:hypothetical protein
MRLVSRPIALLEFVDAQVRRQMNVSCHGPILSGPSRNPYYC